MSVRTLPYGAKERTRRETAPASVHALTLRLHVLSFGRLADVDGEHHDLRGHGGHLVAEAELVGSVHMGGYRILAAGLAVSFIDLLPVRTGYLFRTNNTWGNVTDRCSRLHKPTHKH